MAPSALYVPVENSIELMAVSVRAMLAAPGRKLDALAQWKPRDGESWLRHRSPQRPVKKAAWRFMPSPVTALARPISGCGPMHAAKQRLFGLVYPSFSLSETGWENNVDALLKIQTAEDAKTLRKLADKLAQPRSGRG